jgi:hypothetical protein
MARGRCTFRQKDVTRALRATVAAGIEVQRVEVAQDGKIVLVVGTPVVKGGVPLPLDEWIASHARQT